MGVAKYLTVSLVTGHLQEMIRVQDTVQNIGCNGM
jgi:hypothetical protein